MSTFAFWTSGAAPCHHFHESLLQMDCSQSSAELSETAITLDISNVEYIVQFLALGVLCHYKTLSCVVFLNVV